ncbi:methyltransferase domain-containing protein, partial [Streptomyces klenkii]
MTQLSEPTAARVSALYDQAAELLPEDFGLFPNLHFGYWEGPEGDAEGEATLQDAAARLTGLVAARLGAGPGTRMLDVGCGVGGPALQIARATGCHVVGITLSAGQVGLARALADRDGASDRLAFLRADAAELPFEDDSFD